MFWLGAQDHPLPPVVQSPNSDDPTQWHFNNALACLQLQLICATPLGTKGSVVQ